MSMSSSPHPHPHPHAVPSHDAYAQSEAKRRRLRKGTHSCWECKRRKMKCTFDDSLTNTTTICTGCRRRGSQCVSQKFPDVAPFSTDNTLTTPRPIFGGEGVLRGESQHPGRYSTLSNGIAPLTPPSEDGRRADFGISSPASVSMSAEPSRHRTFYASSEVRMPDSRMMMVPDTASSASYR